MAAKKSRKIILIDHEDLQPKRFRPSGPSASQTTSNSSEQTPKAAAEQEDSSSQSVPNGAAGESGSRRDSAGVSSARATQPLGGGATKPGAGQRPSAIPPRPQVGPPGYLPRPASGSLPRPGWPSPQENRRPILQHNAQGPQPLQQNVTASGGPKTFMVQSNEGHNRTLNREAAGATRLQMTASNSLPHGIGGPRTGKEAGPNHPVRQDFGQKVNAWQHPGKRASAAPKASPMLERLQMEATCQKLWDPPDESELKPLPGDFPSVDAYIAAFEPFVFAECRAELRQEWQEVCDGSKNHYEVIVTGVEEYEPGGHDVRLALRNPTIRLGMKKDASSLQFREGAVAVLTPAKPDLIDRRRGMHRSDAEKEEQDSNQLRVAGVVIKYVQGELRGDADWLVVRLYADKAQAGKRKEGPEGSGPDPVLEHLKKESSSWWFTPLSNLVTNQREYEGLHSIRHFQGLMKSAILKPKQELFPKYTEQEAPSVTGWLTPAFAEHLQRSFNPPQLASIKWSAAHVAAGTRGKATPAALGGEEVWPFTLIQGPPGTGKTHTVWGILNVVHLVQYQRYFASLLQKLAPGATASAEDDPPERPRSSLGPSSSDGSLDSILSNMDASLKRILPQLSPKPRLLVCAPSNAATDELLARVLDRGFIDGELRSYKPNVARVGLDFGSPAAQAVSVERRANQLLSMKPDEVHQWIPQLQQKEHALRYRMSIVQKELSAVAAASRGGAVGMEPEQLTNLDNKRDAKLQELAALREQHDKLLVELERLLIVAEKYRQGGGSYHKTEGQLRRQLETSFAREAEVVFTTLSSSGREIFERLGHGFDTVVIDEAAQASEMAILPPLRLGCNRCILVGDPQQLPATVISQEAQTMLFSRSLFERFQLAGCPALMLTQQYRMHPVIREFPSRFFYEGRLTDDDSVTARPEEPYHRDPLLRPYVFFDVSKGKEKQGGRSMSLQNKLEADFAVLLYSHFRASLPPGALPRLSVGAITPYKQQSATLKRAFDPIVADIAQEGASITINTVDAYQGQERDIVILSCVRASPKGGVGFVADVRRMNVALTRARRALWILGNAASLCRNPDWEALIQDAKHRGCYVDASHPEALFPPAIIGQVRALQASEQAGPSGQGLLEPLGMQAGRKRQKTSPRKLRAGMEQAGADISGQQSGDGERGGMGSDSGREQSEKAASTSGRADGGFGGLEQQNPMGMRMQGLSGKEQPLFAEARRSVPSRDPRRSVLGRSAYNRSTLGLPDPSPRIAAQSSTSQVELLSPTTEFRPPSPTPGGEPKVEPAPSKQKQDTGSLLNGPAGLIAPGQVEAARKALAALGVDPSVLDSLRWDAVGKGLQEHVVRLRSGGAEAPAPPSAAEAKLPGDGLGLPGALERQPVSEATRAQPGQNVVKQGSSGFGAQQSAPGFGAGQPGAYGSQHFALGSLTGQLATETGGAPGFPTGHLVGDTRQRKDPRHASEVAGITGAGPPPNGLTLLGTGGAKFGGAYHPPGRSPGSREPLANGEPPPLSQVDQQQRQVVKSKPSKKQKKAWKRPVDRDQWGGVGPLGQPGPQVRPQATKDLWNEQDLLGGSLEGIRGNQGGPSDLDERPKGVPQKLGAEREALPQAADTTKRQRGFDLNSVPEDGNVDMDKGPPGFAPQQEHVQPG